MQETRPRSGPRPVRGGTNGARPRPEPLDLVDRSALLRRNQRFPFVLEDGVLEGIRLRRERRVFGSFSGIPRLARRSDR